MERIRGAWGRRGAVPRRALCAALVAVAAVLSAVNAHAQLTQSEFRAADGTAYQLLRVIPPLSSGADRQRITTVVGAASGSGGCSMSGSSVGQTAAAVRGVLPPGQALHPFGSIERTAILSPDSITSVSFDPTNGGHLTLGSGGAAVNICRVASDCSGGGAALVPLTSNTGGVPPGCIAEDVTTTACDSTNLRNVIAFGLPSTGNPPVCNNPQSVTTATFICAPEPSDGFSLTPGQAIVFAYDGSLVGLGFGVGVGGFGVDSNASNNPGCAAGSVVSASSRSDSHPYGPLATKTPTKTATYSKTATGTKTATATVTNTATPTATYTPANTTSATPTATLTATATRTYTPTVTPTGSATATATATPTRTPFCGDGAVEAPEQCDDGNTVSGDCCSSTCEFEVPSSPCADDGNPCTNDECNGAGTCTHPAKPEGTMCEDGDLCTAGSQCVGGMCKGGGPIICDDHDICTKNECVPDIGCLYEIGLESPECGSCTDGIDNNGDGVIDAEDPNCATFNLAQRFAIIGTATNGLRSVRLNRLVKVVENEADEQTASLRAGVCGVDSRISVGVLVTGAVALEGTGKFSGGTPLIHINYQFVNDNPDPAAVITGKHEPLVGPPQCTPCTQGPDCPDGQQCGGQLSINDPANPNVIKTGMAPEFIRCQNLIARVPLDDQLIAGLTPTDNLGQIHLRSGEALTIDLGHGQQVIDLDTWKIARDCQVTINGFEDTVAVFRIAGAFRIGTRTKVTLTGGLKPNNVIWAVAGPGVVVRISSHAEFPGTLLAAKRAKTKIGAFTRIEGALIGKRIRVGLSGIVVHRPFTPLLEDSMLETPNLAIKSANLRASTSPQGNGRARVVVIVDDTNAQTFKDMLLTDSLTLDVKDGGQFDVQVPLTGCAATTDRVVRCRSGDGATRATIKTLRDDPNIHKMRVISRRLTAAQTGADRPIAPVTASLQQGLITRVGSIATCRDRGTSSLSCKMP